MLRRKTVYLQLRLVRINIRDPYLSYCPCPVAH